MPTRDGFPPDRRITRNELNKRLAAPPATKVSGPRVFTRRGETVITDEEEIFFRITAVGTGPRRYAWREVTHDKHAGTWSIGNRTGGLSDDPAFEVNDAVLSSGSTIYKARRSRASGAWTFDKGGGGGGNVSITSGETVLMILGPWTHYKDCPEAPPDPPMGYANLPCDDSRTSEPCVPAYAFAVYQRCGYVWNKVGDSRTSSFGVWATELNGGSTSAWRRFVIPRWGGDIVPETGLPDPDSECMGVAFIGSGASALSCTCPTWASADQCLRVDYTIIDRPFETGNGGYSDCNEVFLNFDDGDVDGPYWGRSFTALFNNTGSLCGDNTDGSGPMTYQIEYVQAGALECFWGPDQFDPCDPCKGFGRFYITGELNVETPQPNCGGSGHFSGYLSIADLAAITCNCAELGLREMVLCGACNGGETLPPLYFVDLESIKFTCCEEPPGEAIFGGSADIPAPDAADGGSSSTPAPDAYSGGGA